MSDDWQSRLEVLVKASKPVIKQFFERHERDELLAVGYVFELWNAGPQFDLVAHIGQPIQTEYRWNSGEYSFPAGLLNAVDELGSEWTAIIDRLHSEAQAQEEGGPESEIYKGLIDISCSAMVRLARSGIFGAIERLDFNVSEVNDPLEVVRARNDLIHAQLQSR